MAHTPGSLRRTPLALALAMALVAGTLAIGLNVASAAQPVRYYSAELIAPSCIAAGATLVPFTAKFTNVGANTGTIASLGSAKIDSDTLPGFSNVAVVGSPVVRDASGNISTKMWTAQGDHALPDGVLLKANTGSLLTKLESVTVSFTATADGVSVSPGVRMKTFAWQSNSYLSFSGAFTKVPSTYPTVPIAEFCGPFHFSVVAPLSTTAGAPLGLTITAKDAAEHTVTSYTGSKTISWEGPANSPSGAPPTLPSPVTFTNGVANLSVQLTNAVPTTIKATDVDGVMGISGPITVIPGTPIVTFSTQPTDTLETTPINGPPTVTAADTFGNPVSGLSITLSVSPDSFAGVQPLGGNVTMSTTGGGVAEFPNVMIALSSSGYKLRTSVGGVDSAAFNITSTLPDGCPTETCTVPFGDTGSTVTVPIDTVLIIENNALVNCGDAITNPIVGTVTVIPPSGPNIDVLFSDPAGSGYQPIPTNSDDKLQYPVCKGGSPTFDPLGDGVLLRYCADSPVPCVKSQDLDLGTLALETVITISDTDPPVRH